MGTVAIASLGLSLAVIGRLAAAWRIARREAQLASGVAWVREIRSATCRHA